MKNKFKFVLINLIVLIILLSSNFQAKNTVKIEYKEKPACIGIIHGSVGNSKGLYYWESYIFAKVDAEVKQTRTGLLGCFRFILPLNREYKITAYKSGFKPMTKEIYLSETHPVREVTFDFFESEPENIKSIEDSKPVFYGFIFGITGGVL